MLNRLSVTSDIITQAKLGGISVQDVMRNKYADIINTTYKNDTRSPIEIAIAEAGFTRNSNMYELLDYSYTQSEQNNDFLFPIYLSEVLEVNRLDTTQQLIYPWLIGGSDTMVGTDMRGINIDMGNEKNKKALDWARIAESADIPIVSVTTGEKTLKNFKIGIGVRQSYETMRRIKIPLAQYHLDWLTGHYGKQMTNAALDVIINGDCNNNAIPVELKATTTTTEITPDDLIDFALAFYDIDDGIAPNTFLATKEAYKMLLKMQYVTDQTQGIIQKADFTYPQSIVSGATIVYVPQLKEQLGNKEGVLMINRERCLFKWTEAGSIISEVEAKKANQTVSYYITENMCFEKRNKYTAGLLTIKS